MNQQLAKLFIAATLFGGASSQAQFTHQPVGLSGVKTVFIILMENHTCLDDEHLPGSPGT